MRSYRLSSFYMDLREARQHGKKFSSFFKGKFKNSGRRFNWTWENNGANGCITAIRWRNKLLIWKHLFRQACIFERFILVGYSMGGRIALAIRLNIPERVSSLILESASPGLKTEIERCERRETDQYLQKEFVTKVLPRSSIFGKIYHLFESQKEVIGRKTASNPERTTWPKCNRACK